MPHISIQLFRTTSTASLACANSTPLAHTLTATLEFGITWYQSQVRPVELATMISDLVEAEMESVAQARRTSPSDEGSTARGGGAPSLASMRGGPVARRTPREVGLSSGARGTMGAATNCGGCCCTCTPG